MRSALFAPGRRQQAGVVVYRHHRAVEAALPGVGGERQGGAERQQGEVRKIMGYSGGGQRRREDRLLQVARSTGPT